MALHPLSTESWMETTDTMHTACQTATGDKHFPSRLENFHQCTKVADCINLLSDDPEHSLLALTLHQDPQNSGCACKKHAAISQKKPDVRLNYSLPMPR